MAALPHQRSNHAARLSHLTSPHLILVFGWAFRAGLGGVHTHIPVLPVARCLLFELVFSAPSLYIIELFILLPPSSLSSRQDDLIDNYDCEERCGSTNSR